MFYTVIDFLKKKVTPLYAPSIGVLMLFSASPLSAALLFQDGFNYTVGQNLNAGLNGIDSGIKPTAFTPYANALTGVLEETYMPRELMSFGSFKRLLFERG